MEKTIAALAIAFSLAGCTTTGIPCEALSIHAFEGAAVDAMTDGEVNQEQSYNELISSRCK